MALSSMEGGAVKMKNKCVTGGDIQFFRWHQDDILAI